MAVASSLWPAQPGWCHGLMATVTTGPACWGAMRRVSTTSSSELCIRPAGGLGLTGLDLGGKLCTKSFFFSSAVWEGVQLCLLHHCLQGNSHGWNHPTMPAKALPVPTSSPGIAMLAAGPLFPANRWSTASAHCQHCPSDAGLPYQQQPDGVYQGSASHPTPVDPTRQPKN